MVGKVSQPWLQPGQYSLASTRPHVTAEPSTHYRLRRYKWRTLLNIIGPLLLLGFYALICFYFLARPPVNNVVIANHSRLARFDARVAYYFWFVVSVFTLEWARVALANFEAAAIMRPRLAPGSAMELMWHGDANWSNILWWLRWLRNSTLSLVLRSDRPKYAYLKSQPSNLWVLLSSTFILVFVAVALGGLSMELSTVSIISSELAPIQGPNPDTFNFKGFTNLPVLIRGSWLSGRQTSPPDASMFYAPGGTLNVSTTYFDDMIKDGSGADSIDVFLGPAVGQGVSGGAWGMKAEIDCQHVPRSDLQMIRVTGFNESQILNPETTDPEFAWSTPFTTSMKVGLTWYNETAVYWEKVSYQLTVAADGAYYGPSPYNFAANHDNYTLSHRRGEVAQDEPTTSFFEAYLWQGIHPDIQDSVMEDLLNNESALIDKDSMTWLPPDHSGDVPFRMAGFAIQCRVRSMMGNATLLPSHRTYNSFERGTSARETLTDRETYAIQVQAVQAIGNWVTDFYEMLQHDGTGTDSTWLNLHVATGVAPRIGAFDGTPRFLGTEGIANYPALRPEDLKLAFYKLFGETMVAVMGSGGQEPWLGDLYTLVSARYIVPGIVPWQAVLVLLSLWSAIVVYLSVWMAFTRRWAPTLGSFQFFQLGAQYTDEVHDLGSQDFDRCEVLRNIPGMLGSLPGGLNDGRDGFVGLSESAADADGTYVLDRRIAARHRM